MLDLRVNERGCKRFAFACATLSCLMTSWNAAKADCTAEMGKANAANAHYMQSQGISNGKQLEETPRTCAEARRFVAIIQTQINFWRNRTTCGEPSAISRNSELSSAWTTILKRQELKESELCKNDVAEPGTKTPQQHVGPSQSSPAASSTPCPDDVGPGMLLTNPGISLQGSSGCNNGSATHPQLQGALRKDGPPNVQGRIDPQKPASEVPGVSPPNPPLISDNGPFDPLLEACTQLAKQADVKIREFENIVRRHPGNWVFAEAETPDTYKLVELAKEACKQFPKSLGQSILDDGLRHLDGVLACPNRALQYLEVNDRESPGRYQVFNNCKTRDILVLLPEVGHPMKVPALFWQQGAPPFAKPPDWPPKIACFMDLPECNVETISNLNNQ